MKKGIKIVLMFTLLLISTLILLGGCSKCENSDDNIKEINVQEDTKSGEDIKSEKDTEPGEDTKSEEDTEPQEDKQSEENLNSEDSILALEIGATTKKLYWTQTLVYPNNIDDTFVIDVCLPNNYDEKSTYPVVYLTDCYWRREDYRAIKELYNSGKTKEFILIGIGYPNGYDFDTIRVRDLVEKPDQFLDMIVNGVIPYVESNYNIDPSDRTFCGASYGGFFMIYSLFQSDNLTKDIFKNYVLASPTLRQYTGGLPLADYEELYWNRTHELNANVYLTVGGEENSSEFLVPIRNFVARLNKREYEGLNLTYQVYEGKDHYSVWVPSLLDGLEKYLVKE